MGARQGNVLGSTMGPEVAGRMASSKLPTFLHGSCGISEIGRSVQDSQDSRRRATPRRCSLARARAAEGARMSGSFATRSSLSLLSTRSNLRPQDRTLTQPSLPHTAHDNDFAPDPAHHREGQCLDDSVHRSSSSPYSTRCDTYPNSNRDNCPHAQPPDRRSPLGRLHARLPDHSSPRSLHASSHPTCLATRSHRVRLPNLPRVPVAAHPPPTRAPAAQSPESPL